MQPLTSPFDLIGGHFASGVNRHLGGALCPRSKVKKPVPRSLLDCIYPTWVTRQARLRNCPGSGVALDLGSFVQDTGGVVGSYGGG